MADQLPAEQRAWWTITIGGYGSFAYYGSDTEAEQMRRHKAIWEGGVGRKQRGARQEDIDAEKSSLRNCLSVGVTLDARQMEAISS